MSGIFQVPFTYTGNASIDLVEINVASTKPCVVLGFVIGQSSDFGDAQEEILQILFRSGQTVSGSGGSAPTPVNNDGSGGSASFAAETANTTKAGTGTITERGKYPWNVRAAYDKMFTEYEQIMLPASSRLTMELPSANDSLTVFGHLLVQEIG